MKFDSLKVLKSKLDTYISQNEFSLFADAIDNDPVGLVHRYSRRGDIELAGLIASCFAFGRRTVFVPVVDRILSEMGDSPQQFLLRGEVSGKFDWVNYRFIKSDDFYAFLSSLRCLLITNSTLENAFEPGRTISHQDRISLFVRAVRKESPYRKVSDMTKGFKYLLPDPADGSACKRVNLFLRWMVRSDSIDFGVWNTINPSDLIVPLDAHVLKTSLSLGLTQNKSSCWKNAEAITKNLRLLDERDPLKYDFPLFSLGF